LTIVLFAASSLTVNGVQFGTRDEAVATSQKLAPPAAAAALSPEPLAVRDLKHVAAHAGLAEPRN
jgi:hypothetical protein